MGSGISSAVTRGDQQMSLYTFKRIKTQRAVGERGDDVIVGVFSRWRWTVAGMPLQQLNIEGFN